MVLLERVLMMAILNYLKFKINFYFKNKIKFNFLIFKIYFFKNINFIQFLNISNNLIQNYNVRLKNYFRNFYNFFEYF